MKINKKISYGIVFLLLLLPFMILFSSSVGSADLSMFDSFQILLLKPYEKVYQTIIWKIRLPRILFAGISGFGLAIVGTAFQGLFKNPLADPHILGVSSGAALGATLAMFSGIGIHFMGLGVISIFAFIGALITVMVVYQLSASATKAPMVNMLLAGTAISTLLSSLISLLMTMRQDQIQKVYMWTLGSFSSATWTKVGFLFFVILLGSLLLYVFHREMDIMLIGVESAESLGIDTKKIRKFVLLIASFMVAACVSVAGVIGFVGLVIPHWMRLIFGPRHSSLLPLAGLCGASFMILCDTIARTIIAPSEIPVGVITSMIGAPYFIFLLYQNRKESINL